MSIIYDLRDNRYNFYFDSHDITIITNVVFHRKYFRLMQYWHGIGIQYNYHWINNTEEAGLLWFKNDFRDKVLFFHNAHFCRYKKCVVHLISEMYPKRSTVFRCPNDGGNDLRFLYPFYRLYITSQYHITSIFVSPNW